MKCFKIVAMNYALERMELDNIRRSEETLSESETSQNTNEKRQMFYTLIKVLELKLNSSWLTL